MSKGAQGPKLVAAAAVVALGTLGWFGWKLLEGPALRDADKTSSPRAGARESAAAAT